MCTYKVFWHQGCAKIDALEVLVIWGEGGGTKILVSCEILQEFLIILSR